MHFVYVLLLSNKNFYIGYSTAIKRRINEHKHGEVKSTCNYFPMKLIFCEIYICKKDAARREQYFKTSKGRTTLRLMLKEYLKTI